MTAKQALYSWGNSALLVMAENADTQLNQKRHIHTEKNSFLLKKIGCVSFLIPLSLV